MVRWHIIKKDGVANIIGYAIFLLTLVLSKDYLWKVLPNHGLKN